MNNFIIYPLLQFNQRPNLVGTDNPWLNYSPGLDEAHHIHTKPLAMRNGDLVEYAWLEPSLLRKCFWIRLPGKLPLSSNGIKRYLNWIQEIEFGLCVIEPFNVRAFLSEVGHLTWDVGEIDLWPFRWNLPVLYICHSWVIFHGVICKYTNFYGIYTDGDICYMEKWMYSVSCVRTLQIFLHCFLCIDLWDVFFLCNSSTVIL